MQYKSTHRSKSMTLSAARTCLKLRVPCTFEFRSRRVPACNQPPRGYLSVGLAVTHRQDRYTSILILVPMIYEHSQQLLSLYIILCRVCLTFLTRKENLVLSSSSSLFLYLFQTIKKVLLFSRINCQTWNLVK